MNNTINVKKISIIILGWLLISTILGLVIAKYQITAILTNNTYQIDIPKLKTLKREMGTVATNLIKSGGNQHSAEMLKKIADDKWWEENLILNFKFVKQDIRGLINIEIPKDEAMKITSISIINKGRNQESAINETQEIIEFLRESAIYLEYKNLIDQYQLKSKEIEYNYSVVSTKNDLELSYLQLRKKNLLELYKQYPTDNDNSKLIFEQNTNDNPLSFEKYLSLKTQLIALQIDINRIQELSTRQNDLFAEAEQLKQFVTQARLAVNNEYNGLILHKKLENIINSTQNKQTLQNASTSAQILRDINNIKELYTVGISNPVAFNIKALQLYIFILAGLLIGLTNILALNILNKNQ